MTVDEIIKRWGAKRIGYTGPWQDVTVEFRAQRAIAWSEVTFDDAVCEVFISEPGGAFEWIDWLDDEKPPEFGDLVRELVAFAAQISGEPSTVGTGGNP